MSEENTQQNVNPAQESRFDAGNYCEALTAFSAGYRDPENLAQLIEFLAPAVPVGRRFEFKKAQSSQAFLCETDDVRAIGSAFKQVEYSGKTVYEKTHNKGLTIRVDNDEMHGDDWQERYVKLLIQRLHRNELRRVLQALDQAADQSDQTWDEKSNPDALIRSTLSNSTDKTGIRPNRILFGEGAWDKRAGAFEAKSDTAAYRSADSTPAQLAQKLLVDEIKVMRARFQDSGDKKARFLDNCVYAYFAQSEITKDEPSNIKRFVTPIDGASPFRVYVEEHPKFTDITVEHYSNIVVTSDIGIEKVNLK